MPSVTYFCEILGIILLVSLYQKEGICMKDKLKVLAIALLPIAIIAGLYIYTYNTTFECMQTQLKNTDVFSLKLLFYRE